MSMGNNPVIARACLAVMLSLGLLFVGRFAEAAEKKKEVINFYEVPTSGKIIDVEYRPEFDEWWVKCREADTIAVYSYDKRGNKWGKIVFAPKKSEEQGKPGAAGDTGPSSKGEKTGSGPQFQTKKPESKSHKTKWWDPLNIIKGGEKLILPHSPSEKK